MLIFINKNDAAPPLSLLIRILSLCLIGWIQSVFAALIVEESFTDGSLIGGGDTGGLDWFAGTAATIAILDDSAGLQGGNALQLISTSEFSRVTGVFSSEVSISSTGDLPIWTLKLRMTRFSAANNGGIRFGPHQDNGSSVNAATEGNGWTANTEGWNGYYFRGGVGGKSAMRIFRDLNYAGNSALEGSGDVTVGNGTAWTPNSPSIADPRRSSPTTIGPRRVTRPTSPTSLPPSVG